jgi:hypothetical protein
MKNLLKISLIFLLSLSAVNFINAQKALSTGSITYDMKMDKDNPMAGMLSNTNMVVSFKGNLVKTAINIMGGMASFNIIMDSGAKKGIMLMSMPMMGKNMAVEMTPDDVKNAESKSKENQSVSKIEYNKKNNKKIAGYKCHQAIAKVGGMPDGVTLYVTDKIKPGAQTQIQNQIPGLNGFPLGFEVVQAGMKINFEASKVDKASPADSEFDMTIPAGFQKVTMEELKSMGGGLGTFGL